MAQRRPGKHLCFALSVPRVRLLAVDEQRGLARDAEVRYSGARSHRLRAVAGAARPTACRAGTFAVLSWSKVWDVEAQCCPMGSAAGVNVDSKREGRLRLDEEVLDARGEFAVACRRGGRSARRTGPREVRLINLARHV